ncbi:hypothetical protein ACFL1R_10805 [Candidatus Latescibacterota bacterium]
MRKFIVFVTLILLVLSTVDPQAAGYGKRIIFLPFYDDSGYRGPWELDYEVPQMIGDMLGGTDDYFYVIPMDSVRQIMENPEKPNIFKQFLGLFVNRKKNQKILTDAEILSAARTLGSDIVINGEIKNFSFNRTGGVEPMIGGYKRYSSKVTIERVRVLRVSDGRSLGIVSGEESNVTGGLGLELFGKPRRMDYEFLSLDSLDFGSKRFINTLMGQTTIEALNKVQKELRTVISRPDTSWFSMKNFKVVSIDDGIAYIDAGSEDGISAGDRFIVYTPDSDVRVGKINVINVFSAHASSCEILDGKDEIRPGDRIMPEF